MGLSARELDALVAAMPPPAFKDRERTSGERDAYGRDEDALGRIESALVGHESTWHLRVNRLARGALRATYEVTHARVPVRAQPHLESSILRIEPRGARVVGVSITDGSWLELAGTDDLNGNIEGGRGWMLTEHPEFGRLLRHVDGVDLPSTTLRLASAEDIFVVDHTKLAFMREYRMYRVCHSPFVPIRKMPSTSAVPTGHAAENQLIRSTGRQGDWILVETDKSAVERVKSSNSDADRVHTTADVEDEHRRWMLVLHPEHGQLLKPCHEDGSDIIA